MKGILRAIDGLSLAFGWVAVFMTWALVFIVFGGVVARYIFNSPIIWVPEMSQFLFGASFMLSGAYTLQSDGHVRIDILVTRLSRRCQAVLECFTSIAFWLFSSILLYKGTQMAMKSFQNNETAGTYWDPPIYPIKIAIPLAAALILLQGICKLATNINTIVKVK